MVNYKHQYVHTLLALPSYILGGAVSFTNSGVSVSEPLGPAQVCVQLADVMGGLDRALQFDVTSIEGTYNMCLTRYCYYSELYLLCTCTYMYMYV